MQTRSAPYCPTMEIDVNLLVVGPNRGVDLNLLVVGTPMGIGLNLLVNQPCKLSQKAYPLVIGMKDGRWKPGLDHGK